MRQRTIKRLAGSIILMTPLTGCETARGFARDAKATGGMLLAAPVVAAKIVHNPRDFWRRRVEVCAPLNSVLSDSGKVTGGWIKLAAAGSNCVDYKEPWVDGSARKGKLIRKIGLLNAGDIIVAKVKSAVGPAGVLYLEHFSLMKKRKYHSLHWLDAPSPPLRDPPGPLPTIEGIEDVGQNSVQPDEDPTRVTFSVQEGSPEARKQQLEEESMERWRMSLPVLGSLASKIKVHTGVIVNGQNKPVVNRQEKKEDR